MIKRKTAKLEVTVSVAERYMDMALASIADAIAPLETTIAEMTITVRKKDGKPKLHGIPGKKTEKPAKPSGKKVGKSNSTRKG